MAPFALKRPGAATAQSAVKKVKVNKTAAPYADILTALRADGKNHNLMLANIAASTIGVYKSERHAYQHKVVEMIGKALDEKAASLQATVDEGRMKVDGAGAEKMDRQQALIVAEDALNALQAALEKKKINLVDGKAELTNAIKVREETESAHKDAKDAHAKLLKSKEVVDTFITRFSAAKSVKNDSKSVKSIVKAARELDVDSTMISSISVVISKELTVRGEFDEVVLSEFDATLVKIAAEKLTAVEAEAPREAERASTLEAAKATELAAVEATDGIITAIANAKAAVKDSGAKLSRARYAVDNYILDMKAVMDDYDDSCTRLLAFRAGPLTTFAELLQKEAPIDESPTATEAKDADALEPQVAAPEVVAFEAAAPEAAASEAATLEIAAPETASMEAAAPEVATPEVATPEAAAPEAATLDIAAPETATPEAAAPEAPM